MVADNTTREIEDALAQHVIDQLCALSGLFLLVGESRFRMAYAEEYPDEDGDGPLVLVREGDGVRFETEVDVHIKAGPDAQ